MSSTKTTEQIIKEAEELYELIGLDPFKDKGIKHSEVFKLFPYVIEEPQKTEQEDKLHWTRLSINSNSGCIVE